MKIVAMFSFVMAFYKVFVVNQFRNSIWFVCSPIGIYNIHQRQMNSRFSLQCIWFLFVLSRRSNSSKPETLCANILETAFARGKDENNSVSSLNILQFFDLPDIFSCSPQSLGESSICYNDDQYVSWENTLKRKNKLKFSLPLIVDNVKA